MTTKLSREVCVCGRDHANFMIRAGRIMLKIARYFNKTKKLGTATK